MLAALAHRGLDGQNLYHHGPIAMGCQHFWTTAEEVGEYQPVASPCKQVFIVFDGRLDNRAELTGKLVHNISIDPDCSDATLVLLAYHRWGEQCAEHLLGPFAFVIYDEAKQSLLCGRDPLGQRTLFYQESRGQVLIASEECALLANPLCSSQLNSSRLSSYFALLAPQAGETFFQDITELPPAHTMLVAREHTRQRAYWKSRLEALPANLGNDYYAERFLEILNSSVTACMRARSAPGSTLSGGMDSSPVAALAAAQLRSQNQKLNTYSWVFDELTECDESHYIRLCEQHLNSEPHWLAGDDCWPMHYPDIWPYSPSSPESNIFRHLKQRLYHRVAENGQRVLLSSASGDIHYSVMTGWLRSNLQYQGMGAAIRATYGIYQHWGLKACCRSLATATGLHRPSTPSPRHYHWMNPVAAATATAIDEQKSAPAQALRPAQYTQLLASNPANGMAREDYYASRSGIELRDPYLDLRLVEFMLSLPDHQLYGPDGFKQIARHASKRLLPDEIRLRPQSTSLSALAKKGFEQVDYRSMQNLKPHEADFMAQYINMDWLADIVDNKPISEGDMLAFWQVFAFRLWLTNTKL